MVHTVLGVCFANMPFFVLFSQLTATLSPSHPSSFLTKDQSRGEGEEEEENEKEKEEEEEKVNYAI